jgi:hypothetical protein
MTGASVKGKAGGAPASGMRELLWSRNRAVFVFNKNAHVLIIMTMFRHDF